MTWLRSKPLMKSTLLGAAVSLLAGPADAQAPLTTQAPPRASASQQVAHRNVLLLIMDDQNTDLGIYGAPVSTPNVDHLAREGVRFQHAYTQFPICGPTRASFLTGLRPNTIGPGAAFERFRCTLPDVVTLPQYFRQNGFFTARVGKVFHQGVPKDIGTSGDDDAQSWDQVVNPRGVDKDLEGQVHNLTPGIPGLGRANSWLAHNAPDTDFTDGKVADGAIAMLQANKSRPFFLAVGFYRPHVPEIAPAKYFAQYPPKAMTLAKETPDTLSRVLPIATNSDMMNLGMTEDQQRQMVAAYHASTSFVDAQVGRVLQELKRLGLDRNTVVVLIGDHGYMLGEHGQWQKSLLWEEATRVPMIVRAPGGNVGGVASQTVEMLDLYPTIASLAGLPANPSNEGRSLVSLLQNPAREDWHGAAFSQILGGRSIRTDRWRYTEWEGGRSGRELYDHARDLREQHNLAQDPKYAGIVAQLRARLPQGVVEKRGKKTLSDPQTPKPPLGRYPVPEGCEHLERLTE